jgi:hypothetical protein
MRSVYHAHRGWTPEFAVDALVKLMGRRIDDVVLFAMEALPAPDLSADFKEEPAVTGIKHGKCGPEAHMSPS